MKRAEWRWGEGGGRSEWIIEGHRREYAHSCRLILHLVRRWPLPSGTVSLREERWKEEGRQGGRRKQGENDGKHTGRRGRVGELCRGCRQTSDKTEDELYCVKECVFRCFGICLSTSLLVTHVGFVGDDRKEGQRVVKNEWVRTTQWLVVGSWPETERMQNSKLGRSFTWTAVVQRCVRVFQPWGKTSAYQSKIFSARRGMSKEAQLLWSIVFVDTAFQLRNTFPSLKHGGGGMMI